MQSTNFQRIHCAGRWGPDVEKGLQGISKPRQQASLHFEQPTLGETPSPAVCPSFLGTVAEMFRPGRGVRPEWKKRMGESIATFFITLTSSGVRSPLRLADHLEGRVGRAWGISWALPGSRNHPAPVSAPYTEELGLD